MKSLLLVVLGVFCAAMAVTVVADGDPLMIVLFGTAFTYWSWRSFRALRRRLAITRPAPADKPRPWEH